MAVAIQGTPRAPSRPLSRLVLFAAVTFALLVSGCGGSGHLATRATPAKAVAPTASPTTAVQSEPVLAVVRKSGALELYGVKAGPTAHRLRILRGPAGMTASSVTLSSGEHPTVCATWDNHDAGVLECYARGSDTGTVVPVGGETANLALSYAGTSLAWTADNPAGVPDLFYARLMGTTAGRLTRVPALAPGDERDDATLGAGPIAWEGEDTLLVSHSYDDDVNGAVARVSLSAPPQGWTNAHMVDEGDNIWPVLYGMSSATNAGKALALQEGFFGSDGAESFRAVQIDVATGQVGSVVALAAKDRQMRSVSGGAMGVLYRTDGSDGLRTYWRAPGQAHGLPLTGIPSDVTVLVAQP